MVTLLTNKHYTTIRNFSRKISKGVNSDDLSQHVILKLLQKDTKFINGLIRRDEFDKFIWVFIKRMFIHSGSSFNRVETETVDPMQRKIKVSLDGFDFPSDMEDDEIDLKYIIKRAGLTDIERMYLNAYMDNNANYLQCSNVLDVHWTTISKYVKKAINKCKKSL
tara:strand:+ start:7229 stop:7723 length:495 start_codon:yes stop_codon:yes gene_type:complete